MRYDISLANIEAKQCQDLLSQVQYYVSRAYKKDNDEHNMRHKQEKERELYRIKQKEEQNKALQKQEEQRREMMIRRQEYREKTKNALVFEHVLEKPKGKGKRRKNNGSDSDESIASVPNDKRSPRPSKSNTSKRRLYILCISFYCRYFNIILQML